MKRRFKIKFNKAYLPVTGSLTSWREVTDSCLLYHLNNLKSKYDFEVISTNFNKSFYSSSIVIKCQKQDKDSIFSTFVIELGNYITNVSY